MYIKFFFFFFQNFLAYFCKHLLSLWLNNMWLNYEQTIKFFFLLILAMAMQEHILAGHLGCPVPPPHPTTVSDHQGVHLQTGERHCFYLFHTGFLWDKATSACTMDDIQNILKGHNVT